MGGIIPPDEWTAVDDLNDILGMLIHMNRVPKPNVWIDELVMAANQAKWDAFASV